jgi:hypothetical protein
MLCKLLEKNDPIELIIALLRLWCMYLHLQGIVQQSSDGNSG